MQLQNWWHILEYLKQHFFWAAKSDLNRTGFLKVFSPLILDWKAALMRLRLLLLFSLSVFLARLTNGATNGGFSPAVIITLT